MNRLPLERRTSSATNAVAELLRRLLTLADRDGSLDMWLAFPQNGCSFGFGHPPRPLPIGALFVLWAHGYPFTQPCPACGHTLRMISFGGLLTIGGGTLICATCEESFFQPIGGLGTVSQVLRGTKLGRTEFAPSRMVFGGAVRSDGAALFDAVGLGRLGHFSESKVNNTSKPSKDDVVEAVMSGARNARRLATEFTSIIGDPTAADFPEIASGGFVYFRELRASYEIYDDLWPLEERISARRIRAVQQGAALSPKEKLLYTKRKLAAYFREPVDGAGYLIAAVTDSTGRTAYWTEVRQGSSWEGIDREVFGMFRSLAEAKAALRRKGLISARDYPPLRGGVREVRNGQSPSDRDSGRTRAETGRRK